MLWAYRKCVKIPAGVLAGLGVGLLVSGCSGAIPGQATNSSSALHGDVSALSARPIRLAEARGDCPVSGTRPISIGWGGTTGGISGYATGQGPVWLVMAEESLPISPATVEGRVVMHGAVLPWGPSSTPGWGALKTVWLSLPTYKGPYLVRGEPLDGTGPVRIGGSPSQGSFVVPPGESVNGGHGYRPGIAYVWLRQPGCYGFQIDGTTFTHTVVIFVLPSHIKGASN